MFIFIVSVILISSVSIVSRIRDGRLGMCSWVSGKGGGNLHAATWAKIVSYPVRATGSIWTGLRCPVSKGDTLLLLQS